MGKYQTVVKARRNNFPLKAKQHQHLLSLQDRKRADQVWKKLVKIQAESLREIHQLDIKNCSTVSGQWDLALVNNTYNNEFLGGSVGKTCNFLHSKNALCEAKDNYR